MKTSTAAALCVLTVLLVLGLGYSKAQPDQIAPMSRIGVVSVMKILQDSQKNTNHIKEASAEQNKMRLELQKLAEEVDTEQAQLQTFRPDSPDYLEQYKAMIDQQAKLEAMKEYYRQVASTRERLWTGQLYEQILNTAKEIAREKGLTMVFEQTEPEFPIPEDRFAMTVSMHKLIYCEGCVDITDEVLARIDQQ